MRRRLFKSIALSLAMIGVFSTSAVSSYGANSYIPELSVYQQGSSPKVEIGVEVVSPTKYTNFGSSSNVAVNRYWNGNGNQEVTSYDGNTVLKTPDTISGLTGNFYSYPSINSEWNYTDFGKMTSENNKWFSMSARVKATGSTNVLRMFGATGHSNRGVTFRDNNNQVIKYKSSYKTSNKGNVYVTCDSGTVYLDDGSTYILVSSKTSNWGYYYGYFIWHQNGQYFEFDNGWHRADAYAWSGRTSPKYDTFNAGDEVLRLQGAPGALEFDYRDIPNDGQWHTITLNSSVNFDEDFYYPDKNGFAPAFQWKTNGVMYATDVKFGEASRVQVFRDSTNTSNLVYDGYASEYTDTGVAITPNQPTLTSISTGVSSVNLQFNAQSKSEQHYYTSRSYNSSGWSNVSSPKYVTLTSTPSKYYVKLYKNGSLIADGETGGSWSYNNVKRGDVITGQLYTIDTQGQRSSATSVNYTVGQTANDLKSDLNSYVTSIGDSNSIDKAKITSDVSALRTNSNIPYSVTSVNVSNATKYNNGKIDINTSINNETNNKSKVISKRPEYQTEDELKQDIKDYINHDGNFKNSEFKLPSKLDYSSSLDVDSITEELTKRCKTNNNLGTIRIEYSNTATEFSDGSLIGKVYID